VDNLFIGDKLTRNQLQSRDGVTFDVRNIMSPIIVTAHPFLERRFNWAIDRRIAV
jgi:hypothetical protein